MANFDHFNEIVSDRGEIHAVMGEPIQAVVDKVLHHLDQITEEFIARSPFLVMATYGADGHVDLSPKGDPPGFVRVLDKNYMAIPDRPGNRRTDSFHNLLENPQIGLIFFVPGKAETLRVGGEARIVRDEELRKSLAVKGKVPQFAVVVHVTRVFMHCPKCVMRSHLWQPEEWPDSSTLPDIGRAMVQHAKLDISAEELEARAVRDGLLDLY